MMAKWILWKPLNWLLTKLEVRLCRCEDRLHEIRIKVLRKAEEGELPF